MINDRIARFHDRCNYHTSAIVNLLQGAANIKQLASPNFSRLMSSLTNPIFAEFLNFLVKLFKPFDGVNASFFDISNRIVGMVSCCPVPLSAMSDASDNIFCSLMMKYAFSDARKRQRCDFQGYFLMPPSYYQRSRGQITWNNSLQRDGVLRLIVMRFARSLCLKTSTTLSNL